MKEGRIQMFRYQMGGNGFSAQAWYAADDGLEASASPAAPGVLPQVTAQDDFVAEAPRTLPEGVVFLVGEAVSDSRGMQIEAAAAEEGQYQQTWSPPILFYPDGTSSDAIIILANRRYQVVEVTLRGITGMSHSGDVTRIQEYDP
jgi:hypothetical protein